MVYPNRRQSLLELLRGTGLFLKEPPSTEVTVSHPVTEVCCIWLAGKGLWKSLFPAVSWCRGDDTIMVRSSRVAGMDSFSLSGPKNEKAGKARTQQSATFY